MYVFVIQTTLCLLFMRQYESRIINVNSYIMNRSNILAEEYESSLGGRLVLNEDEEAVNKILMHWKEEECEESFKHPQYFNFSKHYFTYKNEIYKSKVYQIIKRMPKGAALHLHSSLMLHVDKLIELTYEDHLYACYTDDHLDLQFSNTVPERPCSLEWSLLSDLRNASNDVSAFDSKLKNFFTLYTENGDIINSDINFTWKRFDKVIRAIKSIIRYRPAREKFFYKALKSFYDDNVMYIEIRTGLSSLYELDGTKHQGLYLAKLYQQITKKFMEDYPDFVGVKIILSNIRTGTLNQIQTALELADKLKAEMPEFFAGFDLVGQEDLGKPLFEFFPVLYEAKEKMNFYFHGGETDWFGTSTDENLIDAVLLGTKRIGHAFALIKHPTLLKSIKDNDIALEVNVISNVVLSLIQDVRNHPLASYLAFGLPVVLSSDDPGAWDADPLSHDFYIAFSGVASRHADLRMLKQLAINSIKYSALDEKGKTKLFEIFNRRWKTFLKEIIATTY
ncbi:adenosine deaminase 2-like [Achroia grisella]|uniref:adenosine deaminase 2-like n=1 Tax=Achroia grisella TaxID=688607 RepID=UPI0027D29B22|nr:adenosine deaminase 2-like [Achroia grisella]